MDGRDGAADRGGDTVACRDVLGIDLVAGQEIDDERPGVAEPPVDRSRFADLLEEAAEDIRELRAALGA